MEQGTVLGGNYHFLVKNDQFGGPSLHCGHILQKIMAYVRPSPTPFFWQCRFCISHLVFCICGFSSAVVTNECCRGGNANRFNHLCASQQILNLSLHWKKYIFLIKICSEIIIQVYGGGSWVMLGRDFHLSYDI